MQGITVVASLLLVASGSAQPVLFARDYACTNSYGYKEGDTAFTIFVDSEEECCDECTAKYHPQRSSPIMVSYSSISVGRCACCFQDLGLDHLPTLQFNTYTCVNSPSLPPPSLPPPPPDTLVPFLLTNAILYSLFPAAMQNIYAFVWAVIGTVWDATVSILQPLAFQFEKWLFQLQSQ